MSKEQLYVVYFDIQTTVNASSIHEAIQLAIETIRKTPHLYINTDTAFCKEDNNE